MRNFPYGQAALCILILAIASGLWLAANPIPPKKATLSLWVFARTHYDAYKPAISDFEKDNPGVTVDLQLVSGTAVTSRLQAAFWADLNVPDLVETEISSAGMFFRGPLENIGFRDLTDKVHQSGLYDRMVQARFAPYSSRGRIFGIPHDVHPVMIAYRRDIFEQEGVDVNAIKTWDDFIRVGRRLTIPNKRYMIELSTAGTGLLEIMLYQRGGGFFDERGNCIFDNEIGVQTMLWYVPLVAGPNRIAGDMGGGQIFSKAVEDGYLLCILAPDWRTGFIERQVPRVSGKMALMPLPVVQPGGRPTSTWGGTMIGITKKCKNPDLAWKLAVFLYADKRYVGMRFRESNIIPCARDTWDDPSFYEPREYWSNQQIGKMYAQLAPYAPYQFTSPYIVTAKGKLSEALSSCVQYYNQNGEKGFEVFTRARLKKSADHVRKLIERNPYQ